MHPRKLIAEIPAIASARRDGATSRVKNLQSSESRATTLSKRNCAGLPAAGWPRIAITSCRAGFVMTFSTEAFLAE
jgi:hypothetical protein